MFISCGNTGKTSFFLYFCVWPHLSHSFLITCIPASPLPLWRFRWKDLCCLGVNRLLLAVLRPPEVLWRSPPLASPPRLEVSIKSPSLSTPWGEPRALQPARPAVPCSPVAAAGLGLGVRGCPKSRPREFLVLVPALQPLLLDEGSYSSRKLTRRQKKRESRPSRPSLRVVAAVGWTRPLGGGDCLSLA